MTVYELQELCMQQIKFGNGEKEIALAFIDDKKGFRTLEQGVSFSPLIVKNKVLICVTEWKKVEVEY